MDIGRQQKKGAATKQSRKQERGVLSRKGVKKIGFELTVSSIFRPRVGRKTRGRECYLDDLRSDWSMRNTTTCSHQSDCTFGGRGARECSRLLPITKVSDIEISNEYAPPSILWKAYVGA